MSTEQGFPALAGPMVDGNGLPTQPWSQFFLSLWNRTGSAAGISSADLALITLLQGARPSSGGGGGGGTVTSVDISSVDGSILPTGGPITTSGVINLAVVDAPKWTDARTLTLSGDLTGSQSFDGSADFNLAATIANNAVTTAKIANGNVTLAKLANQADQTILSNISGSAGPPAANTLTAILDDILGTAQGSLITRTAAGWESLGPGSADQVLTTHGAAADLTWENAPPPSAWMIPMAAGTEPLAFVSNGAGWPTLIPWSP